VAQVLLPNRPGELARVAAHLGEANININYAYAGDRDQAFSTCHRKLEFERELMNPRRTSRERRDLRMIVTTLTR